MPPQSRICSRTGLALTAGPVQSFRIARESFGPLNPPVRTTPADVTTWSRYDTPGRTIYTSGERVTAFMEMLAPYRTNVADERRALQSVATGLGISLDTLWNSVLDDWNAQGVMHPLWLPWVFRDGREISTLHFPSGWWIDINATETINALPDIFESVNPGTRAEAESLTISDLTGEDRHLTTLIASILRENVQLDDATLPLGIEFTSKHGHPSGQSGTCWAYWMRSVDAGLPEPATALETIPIRADDADFVHAQTLCKIKSR